MEEQKINKIEITTKDKLDELYNCSALTFTGVSAEEESLMQMVNWIKEHSEVSNPIELCIIKGETMNEQYGLTEDNKYQSDLTIIAINSKEIKNMSALVIPRFEVGGRWFDDIVNNNMSREKHSSIKKEKPKCQLVGQDGNIFNLMGIASRVLNRAGMRDESKEMCDRITSSKSYDEALGIIMEYVEDEGLEDEYYEEDDEEY